MSQKDVIASEWLARMMFCVILIGFVCLGIERFCPDVWEFMKGLVQ